jgi:hypothetical protein
METTTAERIRNFLTDHGIDQPWIFVLDTFLDEDIENIAAYMDAMLEKGADPNDVVFDILHDIRGIAKNDDMFYPRFQRWIDAKAKAGK